MLRNRHRHISDSYWLDVDILDSFKAKGHKELVGFLFNDFLLLATPLSSATSNSLFDAKTKAQYRMYKSVSV